MALGLSDFRLRLRGEDGLLQVRAEQAGLACRLLAEPPAALTKHFRAVFLDVTPREARET